MRIPRVDFEKIRKDVDMEHLNIGKIERRE